MSVHFLKMSLGLLQQAVPNKRSGYEMGLVGGKGEVTATRMGHADFVEREQQIQHLVT